LLLIHITICYNKIIRTGTPAILSSGVLFLRVCLALPDTYAFARLGALSSHFYAIMWTKSKLFIFSLEKCLIIKGF